MYPKFDAKVTILFLIQICGNLRDLREIPLQISPETPEFPSPDIPQILFMFISLPLKTDHVIGLVRISVLHQPDEIFKKIPDKKRQHQQFQLLLEMYPLVIHKNRVALELPAFDEYERPEHYPVEAPGQHIFIYNHEHAYKIRNAKFVI